MGGYKGFGERRKERKEIRNKVYKKRVVKREKKLELSTLGTNEKKGNKTKQSQLNRKQKQYSNQNKLKRRIVFYQLEVACWL